MFFGLFGGNKKRTRDLIAAVNSGDAGKRGQLLSQGADINAFDPASGDTALIAAVDTAGR